MWGNTKVCALVTHWPSHSQRQYPVCHQWSDKSTESCGLRGCPKAVQGPLPSPLVGKTDLGHGSPSALGRTQPCAQEHAGAAGFPPQERAAKTLRPPWGSSSSEATRFSASAGPFPGIAGKEQSRGVEPFHSDLSRWASEARGHPPTRSLPPGARAKCPAALARTPGEGGAAVQSPGSTARGIPRATVELVL